MYIYLKRAVRCDVGIVYKRIILYSILYSKPRYYNIMISAYMNETECTTGSSSFTYRI